MSRSGARTLLRARHRTPSLCGCHRAFSPFLVCQRSRGAHGVGTQLNSLLSQLVLKARFARRRSVFQTASQRSHDVFPPSKRHGLRSSFALPAAARTWLMARLWLAATAQAVTLGTFPVGLPRSFAAAAFRFRSAALHTLHSDVRKHPSQAVSPARQESWICFGYGSRV